MSATRKHTDLVKKFAHELGFDYCGIAKAHPLDEDARRLEAWLQKGMHGSMKYMENYFDLRVDPRLLVPGARSVITLLKNYFPPVQQSQNTPGISKYAFGKDYHQVIREQMRTFLESIRVQIGD